MIREPSAGMNAYMLFLFITCVVTSIKLIKVWRIAPLFRLSRLVDRPHYLQLLLTSTSSLRLWIGLTFLGWGIFASVSLYKVCDKLLDENRIGNSVILFIIEDFSTAFTMTLLAVLFLFVVRWHLLKRIENVQAQL
jgi:hypothetical protein